MNGSGTSGDPWQVTDYDDLKKVGRGYDAGDDETYALADWYILTADIDASASATENGTGDPVVYAGWDPIGADFDTQFNGVLDGDGHSITGLYMNRPALHYAGFFGRMGVNPSISSDARGIVRNLSIVDADMTGNRAVGILAGDYFYNDTFALESSDNSGIFDVFVSGTMTVSGSASTDMNSGGLLGGNFGGVARNCTALVDMTFNRSSGTRRTGAMFDSVAGDISDCRFIGSMTFNTTTSADIGGFARRVFTGGVVNNCYSVCEVTGAANANGFAADDGGTATNSFWDTDVGPTASGLATGKTTSEMQDIDTYTDTATVGLTTAWDMTTEALHDGDVDTAVWYIDDGVDYPRLWFEYSAPAASAPMPQYIYGE